MDNRIYLLDVTNRDGVQTSRLGLAKLEKTVLNILLNRMGVYQSEFGFPTTHHEKNYVNANLELAQFGVIKPMRLSGWMRAMDSDVDLAFKNCPKLEHINVSISTSEQMINGKFTKSTVVKCLKIRSQLIPSIHLKIFLILLIISFFDSYSRK